MQPLWYGFGNAISIDSALKYKVLEDLSIKPMTTTELAAKERKHASHVSRAISELRAQRLIAEADRNRSKRNKQYRATEEGMRLCIFLLLRSG